MKPWIVYVVLVASLLYGQSTSASSESLSADERQGRIFAYYSTTSYTKLTTTTITGLSICLSTQTTGGTPATCKRRKKRSLAHLVDVDDELSLLETSVNEEVEARDKRSVAGNPFETEEMVDRDGRILTIWTTAFQTITLTTTSALSGTTVTASAFCTVSDGIAPINTCFV